MADIAISALPNAATLDGTEVVPAVQAGSTVKFSVNDIQAFLAPSGLSNSTFLATDPSAKIISLGGWNYNSINGANVNLSYQPNNLAQFYSIQNFNSDVDPLQNSPDDVTALLNLNLNLDPNSTGFQLGTNGTGAYLINANFSHQGTSSTGGLGVINSYSNIGNGTDPINVKGMLGYSTFADINSGVTLSHGLQGFVMSINVHTGATFSTSDAFSAIFADNNQIVPAVNGYASFQSNCHVTAVQNNTGFTSFYANPEVDNFEGNSSATMYYVGGTFANGFGVGGGGYQGVQLNPNIGVLNVNSTGINLGAQITSGTADWTFLNINGSGVTTSGNLRGIVINMPQSDVAIDSQGHHNLSSSFSLVSGQGQMYGNVIGGTIVMPNGTAITGTDVLANNMAFGVDTGDAGSSWTAASVVGLTTLGFVGQIVGAGTLTGAINFCLAGYSDQHTGHIDRVNNFHAAAVPTGAGGTMDESVLYLAEAPYGGVATDNWGFRADKSAGGPAIELENYMDRLAIGPADYKVSNAAIGLEVSNSKVLYVSSSGGICVGPTFATPGHAVEILGGLRADSFISADDTPGGTQDVTLLGTTTVSFKNGIFVGAA